MSEQVFFLSMFPDFVPPEDLQGVLSQAVIAAADIDPETHCVSVALYSEHYIPGRCIEQLQRDIAVIYGQIGRASCRERV